MMSRSLGSVRNAGSIGGALRGSAERQGAQRANEEQASAALGQALT
jgi:hypothetical protein